MRLENRVAVVAGATGALGKVAAREFAKEGAHLVLLGRSLESLETVAREAGLSEDRYLPITADVTDGKATRSAADKTMARFGRVDILLNLVGGYVDGRTVVESDPQELEEMVRQHVWTTFHLAQAFVPHLTANGWGRPRRGLPAERVHPAREERALRRGQGRRGGAGVIAGPGSYRTPVSRRTLSW